MVPSCFPLGCMRLEPVAHATPRPQQARARKGAEGWEGKRTKRPRSVAHLTGRIPAELFGPESLRPWRVLSEGATQARGQRVAGWHRSRARSFRMEGASRKAP
jgi:hypothetical protein